MVLLLASNFSAGVTRRQFFTSLEAVRISIFYFPGCHMCELLQRTELSYRTQNIPCSDSFSVTDTIV